MLNREGEGGTERPKEGRRERNSEKVEGDAEGEREEVKTEKKEEGEEEETGTWGVGGGSGLDRQKQSSDTVRCGGHTCTPKRWRNKKAYKRLAVTMVRPWKRLFLRCTL